MKFGDYLNGFALRIMKALSENGTNKIHILIEKLSEYELATLITLKEGEIGF